MSGTDSSQGGLTRRSFLKTTGVVTGAVAASGICSSLAALSPDRAFGAEDGGNSGSARKKVPTTCMGNCHGFACPMDVFVEDGKVVDLQNFVSEDQPDYHAVCLRGYTNIERCYSPERIQYPLRRVGERGSGEFERISWDEAIDEICTKWKSYQKEYGDASVVFAKGSGSFTATMASYDRLRAYMGATNFLNNYDANGVNSTWDHIGYDAFCSTGNEFRNLKFAKKIFCWGCNPSESAIIAYHFISEAQLNGAKLYVIDPNFTTTAGKADKFIPIRPGTDGLLAIGMSKIILRDGLQDEDNLRNKTVAPFLVKESDGKYLRLSDLGKAEAGSKEDKILVYSSEGVAGELDQVSDPVIEGTFEVEGHRVTTAYSLLLERLDEFDLDDIVEKTDIPLETIEWLAAELMDGPSSILTGFGIDHYSNGITGYINMLTLLDISGQMTKLGTGFSVCDMSMPIAQGLNTTAWGTPKDGKKSPQLAGAYLYDVLEDGGIGEFQNQVKSLFLYVHNVIGNYPERKKWLEIFDKLDLVVTVDVWMSETCRYSDIVLPATYMWEARDIARPNANPYLRLMEKAIEPQFEAKSDFDIAALLAKGMGLGDKFELSIDDFLAQSVDNDKARSYGITWERLQKEGRIYAFREDYVYGDEKFYTTTGRSEFYIEDAKPKFDAGFEWDKEYRALPYWFPPREAWYENDLIRKYPLIFTSERSKFKVHTQFTYVDSLLELESEPYIKINDADAKERGIEDGDVVKLHNDRGYVVIKAYLNPGICPGMVVIDHGWQDDQFIEGHYSDLSAAYVDQAIPGPAWFDCLCEVEKVG
ncbi:dehydrogenase [Gordonibacter sp. 28C]|uniref:molybdopterin-dependent oxidoreductase n=1 Tax=Gordonibacter sp. 28C TaxID=2078569 RepID=UPI000DF84137|nr:molybdopterin-dependent oxidoreductase [Gordonibacter sp. 28C]RDB63966.1 dehydrogenase [Gordonibacter sp. 28C]